MLAHRDTLDTLSFFQNIHFVLIFSKATRDIGNIIAASDRPN